MTGFHGLPRFGWNSHGGGHGHHGWNTHHGWNGHNGWHHHAQPVSLHDGVLSFNADGDYSIVEQHNKFRIVFDNGPDTNINAWKFAAIEALNITDGAHLTIDAGLLSGFTIAGLDGTLDITGVGFIQADDGGGNFEPTVDLTDTLDSLFVTPDDVAPVMDSLTVNGNEGDAFRLVWDLLDDRYVEQGANVDDINESFTRLGLEYVDYLENGGDPLTFDVAKFTPDGGDAGDLPDRVQSMHDNLLGNLGSAALVQRYGGNPTLLAELQALVPDEYEARPYYSGNETAMGGAAHNAVREFDYDHGWDRPDYIEHIDGGTVDARAQDGGYMYYGSGNTIDGWNIVRHEGAGVELALKAKERQGPDYDADIVDGTAVYHVDGGLQPGTTNRAAWSFDFSLTSGISGQDETLDTFDFSILIDRDPGAGTDFLQFDPTTIPDNEGTAYTTGNSHNFAFGYIYDGIDEDPSLPGVQPYDFYGGEFDIVLQAYDDGELIAENHIVVIVEDSVI